MFTRNEHLHFEPREEYRSFESEDLDILSTWGLEDFEDILPERETLDEVVQ
jgi:hypothetical protein